MKLTLLVLMIAVSMCSSKYLLVQIQGDFPAISSSSADEHKRMMDSFNTARAAFLKRQLKGFGLRMLSPNNVDATAAALKKFDIEGIDNANGKGLPLVTKLFGIPDSDHDKFYKCVDCIAETKGIHSWFANPATKEIYAKVRALLPQLQLCSFPCGGKAMPTNVEEAERVLWYIASLYMG